MLDLSRVRSGPNCVRVLADFGADVLRIEPPAGVDPNEVLFASNRDGGDFQNLNRNKRSLTLNLKKPGALAILMRLVAQADVLVAYSVSVIYGILKCSLLWVAGVANNHCYSVFRGLSKTICVREHSQGR